MSEQQLRDVLSAYGDSAQAPDQLGAIVRGANRRRARRRWTSVAVTALVFCFTFMTFAPVGGSALAVIRKEIQPILFLKTNLATARQTVREPLTLPATFPDYSGGTGYLTDDTPALVGRWLTFETVAVSVSEGPDATGVIHFDLRRSTYQPEPGEEWAYPPNPNAIAQPVKVGEYDGTVYVEDDYVWEIYWRTDTHVYSLTAPGAETVEQLIALAEQIH
jgi:hypothetical protein